MRWTRLLAGLALGVCVVVGAFALNSLREGSARVPPVQTQAAQVTLMINELRLGQGLPALRRDAVLASLAHRHNQDMIVKGFFAHDDPTGQSFDERVAYLHRSLVGEIEAWGTAGFGTPSGLISLWMGSREHKANIFRRGFHRIGCSVIVARFEGERGAGLATCDFSS